MGYGNGTSQFMAKTLTCVLLGLAICFGVGCFEGPSGKQPDSGGVIYRHHFAGRAEMARSTNAANLKNALNLPASKQLREQLSQKLSKAPREFWQKEIPATAPDGAEFFKPLLDDLFSAESYLEVRGPTGRPESVLAVKLDDARAKLWSTNLWSLLSRWNLGTPTNFSRTGLQGWEWTGRNPTPRVVQFVRSGEWVLVGLGRERLTALAKLSEKGSAGTRPVPVLTNSWFELEMDWPRLGQWFPLLAKYKLPATELNIVPRGEYLRTEARLRYSKPIPWKYEPWKIPTNTINDPIISFTVGRGIAPLLSQSAVLRDLGLKDLPNQFCAWGQASSLAVTFVSVPVVDGTNVISQLGPRVPKVIKSYLTNHMGAVVWNSNKSEIVWQGQPFVVPRVRPLHDAGTDYLLAETYPVRPKTNAPLVELFGQFMPRTNLVYYDWEITGERLPHAIQLHQYYDVANLLRYPGKEAPMQKWLQTIQPYAGNTVTEIMLTSPSELFLARKSHLGFTGFELASLARWIEAPGFPLRYERPPPLRPKPGTDSVGHTNSLSRSNSGATGTSKKP
jgi:hypothetical protein